MAKTQHRKSPTTTEETRARLLAAASEEFARKGFAGARIEEISKRGKVNKALISYYFGSKKGLYQAVIRALAEAKPELGTPNFPKEWQLTPPQHMYLTLRYFARHHLYHVDPRFHQMIAWELAEEKKQLRKLMQDIFVPRIRHLQSVVDAGIASGDFATKSSLLCIIDLISFMTIYKLSRGTFKGTELFDELYANDAEQRIDEFLADHFMRALLADRKTNYTPSVSNYLEEIDRMLANPGEQS